MLPSMAIQVSARIFTVAILQVLGSYVLFGRSVPSAKPSLVGHHSIWKSTASPLPQHINTSSCHDVSLRHFRILLLQVSIHGCILICTLVVSCIGTVCYKQRNIMMVLPHLKYIVHTITSLASHMVSITYSSAYTHSACTALTWC